MKDAWTLKPGSRNWNLRASYSMKRTKTKTVHVLFVLKTVWMTPKDAAALVKETPYAFILTAEDEAQLKENERRTRELCRHVKAAAEAWKRMDSRVLLGLLK